jgi:hypothetical protein
VPHHVPGEDQCPLGRGAGGRSDDPGRREMCQNIGAEGLGVSEPPLLPLAGGADDPGPIGAGGVRRGPHYALRSRPFANSGVDRV